MSQYAATHECERSKKDLKISYYAKTLHRNFNIYIIFFSALDINIGSTTSSDHDVTDLEVAIPTGTNVAFYTVSIADDDLYEDFETFSVTLSAVSYPSDYIRGANEAAQINNAEDEEGFVIEDDDEGRYNDSPISRKAIVWCC